jgi:hypothetical protein
MYCILQEYVTGTSGQESSSDEHILENVRATEAQVNLLDLCEHTETDFCELRTRYVQLRRVLAALWVLLLIGIFDIFEHLGS